MGSLDIIILLIAVVLIFQKLRTLLGTRPDEEITRARISDENAARIFDIIVKEAERQQTEPLKNDNGGNIPLMTEKTEELNELDKTLAKLPNFNKAQFLTGAKRAFEIIITAFSQGDIETLESLTHPHLTKKFQEIIDQRQQDGITAETDLIGFNDVEILSADIDNENIARITVKFVSEQVNLLRNKNNDVIQGDENFIQSITDTWTFERCLTSSNPNWLLISTKKQ